MLQRKLSYLQPGDARYQGAADRYVRFTMAHQLMNADTWKNFVQVFREDSDDHDNGWRGEYWGKMMRGACLTYMYNGDEGLYAVLEQTVRDMLDSQRPDGRFSTYSAEKQLNGWDIWSRKYILTSMLHFYGICQDAALKEQILCALKRHVDALIDMVGPGKKEITQTSEWWGGVNSCSILDAIMELYRITGEERYLSFGSYIISTGGCIDGDLIQLALENKVMPYQYPEIKAYETISFFEGVLSYYEVTGEEKYLRAALQFVEAVYHTDITIIGCSGCYHEAFDNSAVKQALYQKYIMQETCVTVTWMRMMARLLLLTGDVKYFHRMEQSAYNALYGAVNTNNLKQLSIEENEYVEPLPFESYSPLYNNSRGRGIGGFKRFRFGGYYGCCACIAAAGIAIFPLCAALRSETGIAMNTYLAGSTCFAAPSGQQVTLTASTTYPVSPNWEGKLALANAEAFELKLRIPAFFLDAAVTVNGEAAGELEDGYLCIRRLWQDGDTVQLRARFELVRHELTERTALTYGPLVLARDGQKEASDDLESPVPFAMPLQYTMLAPQGEEQVRMEVALENGGSVLLTDYASCGKNWLSQRNRITVWMNT